MRLCVFCIPLLSALLPLNAVAGEAITDKGGADFHGAALDEPARLSIEADPTISFEWQGDPPLAPGMACSTIGGYPNVRTWVCNGVTQWYKPLMTQGPWACSTALPWKTYVQCGSNRYTLTS
jgi:hypothetical protein